MIFFEHTFIDKNEQVAEFAALDDGSLIGNCTVVLMNNYAEVTKLSYDKDKPFIIEGLIKSALYLAGQRGCYIGRCNIQEIVFYLERMNFIKTEKGYENDIPTILAGSCSKCKNNA